MIVLHRHISLLNLVGDKEIFDVEMSGTLAGGIFPIDSKFLCSFVVVLETGGVCVSLGSNEQIIWVTMSSTPTSYDYGRCQ